MVLPSRCSAPCNERSVGARRAWQCERSDRDHRSVMHAAHQEDASDRVDASPRWCSLARSAIRRRARGHESWARTELCPVAIAIANGGKITVGIADIESSLGLVWDRACAAAGIDLARIYLVGICRSGIDRSGIYVFGINMVVVETSTGPSRGPDKAGVRSPLAHRYEAVTPRTTCGLDRNVDRGVSRDLNGLYGVAEASSSYDEAPRS